VRFVRWGGSLARTDRLRKDGRRLALALGMLAGAALLLALILWLGGAPSPPPDQVGRATPPGAALGRVHA
jgi:hypothetical protein